MMLELLAQVNRFPPPNNPPPDPAAQAAAAGFGFAMIAIYGVVLLVAIGIHIMFLLSLSKCLNEVTPRNRMMEPGQVWLNLIPLFGTVWIFITIIRIAESLEKEFYDRGRRQDGDYGKMTALTGLILSIVGCGCIGIIFIIMYWVKIAGYTKLLRELPRGGRSRRPRDDDEYDDRDDRPRRRRDEDYDDDRG